MRIYTRLEYISPVEAVMKPEEILEQPVKTSLLTSKFEFWGCPDCGAMVWDQEQHNRWHARR